MSSTGALHLVAAAAFVAVIFQLHTRLLELVLTAAEVFCILLLLSLLLLSLLLRQEELRSLLERELSTLRARYKKQKPALASLNHDILEVCKESDIFSRDFPAEICFRRRHGMPVATIRDTEWAEPQLWIKMCKYFICFVDS